MPIDAHRIVRRTRPIDCTRPANPVRDFQVDTEKVGSLEPRALLEDPRVSLYGLDVARRVAAFVRTPPEVDLPAAPFYYQAQFAHADQLIFVPWEELERLMSDDGPGPEALLHIHSVGRCGSTLLSKVLQRVPSLSSLSEPDVYAELTTALGRRRLDALTFRALFATATRFLWRRARAAGKRQLAIKFRAEAIYAQAEITRAAPAAKSIFMYRDAIAVAQSYDRLHGSRHARQRWRLRTPLVAAAFRAWVAATVFRRDQRLLRTFDGVVSGITPERVVLGLGYAGLYALEWLRKVDSYLQLRESDPSAVALRYEDFVKCPADITRQLLELADISDDSWQKASEVLRVDSQEGTRLRRDQKPTPRFDTRDRAALHRLFEVHTAHKRPDVILPGTLACTDIRKP